jgi:phage terminase large subunit-like protein
MYDCPECGVWSAAYDTVCAACGSGIPVLRYPVQEENRKDVLLFAWTPADNIREREEKDRAPYQQWVREGWLTSVPGRSIDFGFVAHKIAQLTGLYDIECIAFDRWRIDDMTRELDAIGATVTLKEWGQGFQDMNPAVQAIEEDVLKGLLRHGDNPLLTWAIGNVKVVSDPAKNRKYDKEKSTGHIDPAQAATMAAGLMKSSPDGAGDYSSVVI